MNNYKKKTPAQIKAEDISVYRLLIMVSIAIVGFALLSALKAYESKLFDFFMTAGGTPIISKIAVLVLVSAALAIAALVFFIIKKYVKKEDESLHVVTSSGILCFFTLLFAFLFLFRFLSNAVIKLQVLFLLVIVLGFIYTLGSKKLFNMSLYTAGTGIALYYIGSDKHFGLDKILEYISDIAVFAVPAVIIGSVICIMVAGRIRIGKKTLINGSALSLVDRIFWISMAVATIVFAVVCMILPAFLVYSLIVYFVLYLTFGILCTIK